MTTKKLITAVDYGSWGASYPQLIELDHLSNLDADAAAISTDHVLIYDGTNWVAQAAPWMESETIDTLEELTDTDTTSGPLGDEVLIYDSGTSMWVSQSAPSAWTDDTDTDTLAALTDTDMDSGPSTDEVLIYDGSSWKAQSVPSAWTDDTNTNTIADLTDTDTSSISTNDVLIYDGTEWVSQSAPWSTALWVEDVSGYIKTNPAVAAYTIALPNSGPSDAEDILAVKSDWTSGDVTLEWVPCCVPDWDDVTNVPTNTPDSTQDWEVVWTVLTWDDYKGDLDTILGIDFTGGDLVFNGDGSIIPVDSNILDALAALEIAIPGAITHTYEEANVIPLKSSATNDFEWTRGTLQIKNNETGSVGEAGDQIIIRGYCPTTAGSGTNYHPASTGLAPGAALGPILAERLFMDISSPSKTITDQVIIDPQYTVVLNWNNNSKSKTDFGIDTSSPAALTDYITIQIEGAWINGSADNLTIQIYISSAGHDTYFSDTDWSGGGSGSRQIYLTIDPTIKSTAAEQMAHIKFALDDLALPSDGQAGSGVVDGPGNSISLNSGTTASPSAIFTIGSVVTPGSHALLTISSEIYGIGNDLSAVVGGGATWLFAPTGGTRNMFEWYVL